jgi:hypothetical protein
MIEGEHKSTRYVRVMDRAGKEYVCRLGALKDPNSASREELKKCFDSSEDAFSDAEVRAIIKSALRKD